MKKRPIFSLAEVNEAAAYVETELRNQGALAHDRADEEAKRQVRMKRDLLAGIIQEASQLDLTPKSVFVSLAGEFRKTHMVHIERFCSEAGFAKVHTGFDDDVHGDLKSGIMFKIMESHAFLGIWSDDFHLKGVRGAKAQQHKTAPRVWMPLELGMALVLGKPYYLILHEQTDSSYLSPVADLVQGRYHDDRSFDVEIRKAATRLFEKAQDYFSQERL